VLDELREQVDVERESLRQLLDASRELIETAKTGQPGQIELWAMAAMLHSFYNGIENVFKRIALAVDHELPRSDSWHHDLLDRLSQAKGTRPPVVSTDLCERLEEYLDFRHFFRHAYSFKLNWGGMSHLILQCEDTVRRFFTEIDTFLRSADDDTERT
jgi:hypothetical protein